MDIPNLPVLLVFWLLFVFLIFFQVWGADSDRMLTVSQMRGKGIQTGLPLIWHFGIWGDLLYLSGLMLIIIERYADQWHATAWLIALSIGLAGSLLLHIFVYAKIVLPEAHAHDGHLTLAGWLHCVYMGVSFAIFILFYFWTTATSGIIIATSIILPIHIMIGSHMLLGILSRPWYGGKPLTDIGGWSGVIIVAGLCAWRAHHMLQG